MKSLDTTSTVGVPGRTPHGVRGLKYWARDAVLRHFRRTPHGVRGLKFGPLNVSEAV